MAITATFKANFDQFFAETQKATAQLDKLVGFAEGVGEVLAGAFTVSTLTTFAGRILDAGSRFEKMAAQTSMSTDEVQRLDYIAGQTDTSVQSLVGAVQNLQQRLGDENSGAAGAMKKLGIHTEAFAKLNAYQQMITLGGAIKDIKDPTEQASAAAAIFGKSWKEILPAIKAGMEEVGEQAPIMSGSTIKALGDMDDALKRARATALVWGASLINGIEHVGFAFGDMLSVFNSEHLGTTNSRMLALAGALNDPNGVKGALVAVKPAAIAVGDALGKVGMSARDVKLATIDLNASVRASIDVNKQAAAEAKKATEEHKRFTDSVVSLTSSAIGAVKGFGPFGALIQDISARSGAFREHMNDLAASFNEFHNGITIAGDEMATVTIPMFSKLPDVVAQGTKALKDASSAATDFGVSLKTGLQDQLAKIPAVLAQAFTGGGGMKGAVQAIGTGLGATIGESFGKQLGGKLGAAMGPVGAIAGAELGKSTSGVLSNTLSGAAIGTMILPGWGTAIGAGVGALVGITKKAFNDAEKKINPLRQAFVDMAGGLGLLNEKAHAAGVTLNAMLNAKNAEQYQKAIEDLNAAFKFQDDAMQVLLTTAQKYGFTLSELGPTLQKQELGKQAEEIYQDFQVLTAGGLDHIAVLTRMSESVNTYIQNASAMGIEVPASMEPMLQQMLDLGLLTDKDGTKLTSLSGLGVTFSTTLTAGFKSIVDAVEKLTAAIAGKLGPAIANIPKSITIDVGYNYQDFNGPDSGAHEMARGGMGRVTKPTLFLAGESGPEDVAFSGGGKSFGGSVGDNSDVVEELRGLRQDMPRIMRDAVLLLG